MSKRKRYTVNQKEYLAKIRKLREESEALMKQGIRFKGGSDEILSLIMTSKLPKRITKRLLSDLNQINLFEYMRYIDRETGEIIENPSELADIYKQKLQRSERISKQKFKGQLRDRYPHETDVVLRTTFDEIDRIDNNYVREQLEDMINDSIEVVGRATTANIIQSMITDNNNSLIGVLYASNQYRAGMYYVSAFHNKFREKLGQYMYTDMGEVNKELTKAFEDDVFLDVYLLDDNE